MKKIQIFLLFMAIYLSAIVAYFSNSLLNALLPPFGFTIGFIISTLMGRKK